MNDTIKRWFHLLINEQRTSSTTISSTKTQRPSPKERSAATVKSYEIDFAEQCDSLLSADYFDWCHEQGHLIPQAQLAAFRAANPDFHLQAIESTNELLASFEDTGVANSTQTQGGDANEDSNEAREETPRRRGPCRLLPTTSMVDLLTKYDTEEARRTTATCPAPAATTAQLSEVRRISDEDAARVARQKEVLDFVKQPSTRYDKLLSDQEAILHRVADIPELTRVNLLLSILFLRQQSEFMSATFNIGRPSSELDDRLSAALERSEAQLLARAATSSSSSSSSSSSASSSTSTVASEPSLSSQNDNPDDDTLLFESPFL